MRERKAYIMLALISLIFSGAVFIGASHSQNVNNDRFHQIIQHNNAKFRQIIENNDHKFCEVTRAVVAVPVPKPDNPTENPSREQSWEWYKRFRDLNTSLGC